MGNLGEPEAEASNKMGIVEDTQYDNSWESPDLEWTPEEEMKIRRKIDMLVMPLLILGYFVFQLDRGNIGYALTDFFFQEVGITQNEFNIGQQLLSVGVILLEIPSNIILYRVGPTFWIGGQIVVWGLIATFQAFQKGLPAYLVIRFLLGCAESGFVPAGLYTITIWYKQDETSKRFSYFYLGTMTAGGVAGLLAYGVLQMRGIGGLGGWQWLFLIEGTFTVLVGVAFIALFPKSPTNPISILGFRYLSERESAIAVIRVVQDDPTKHRQKPHVSLREFRSALGNPWNIPHLLISIAGLAPGFVIMSYAPLLVVSFGFDRLKSNAMVSIGSWSLAVVNLVWGYLADRYKKRGVLVFLGVFILWGVLIGNRLATRSGSSTARFALLVITTAFSSNWHPVNGSWMSLNVKSAGERSVMLAILIIAANCSGIIGGQLLRQEDAPLYEKGWTVSVGLASVALVAAAIANAQYYVLNSRNSNRGLPQLYWP